MQTFGIGNLVSSYRKEFNTEIAEKCQGTESTEKKCSTGLKTRHYKIRAN